MYCTNCGNHLETEAKFCTHCGWALNRNRKAQVPPSSTKTSCNDESPSRHSTQQSDNQTKSNDSRFSQAPPQSPPNGEELKAKRKLQFGNIINKSQFVGLLLCIVVITGIIIAINYKDIPYTIEIRDSNFHLKKIPTQTIELSDLIIWFMLNENDGKPDWELFSNRNNTPFVWSSDKILNYVERYERQAVARVTVNNEDYWNKYANKKKEVFWEINVGGSQSEVENIEIRPNKDCFGKDASGCGFELEAAFSNNGNKVKIKEICPDENAIANYEKLYEISLDSKKKAYLVYGITTGSGGVSNWIVLWLKLPDKENIPEEDCFHLKSSMCQIFSPEAVKDNKISIEDKLVDNKHEASPDLITPPITHKVGDTYVTEVTKLGDQKPYISTERRIVSIDRDKMVVESMSLLSKKKTVRTLEFTPEWNLIRTRNPIDGDLEYSPPLQYCNFPLFPGKKWQQKSVEKNLKTGLMREHTLDAVVGDWETITVPAGTFKAIKITTNTEVVDTTTGEKKSGVDTSWYSPDAKKTVKTVATSKKGDGGEEQQEILLVSLKLNSSNNSEENHKSENKRIGPQKRYIDNHDGTVMDSVTNLIWMKCAVGQIWSDNTCTGKAKEISWIEANRYHTVFAGHSDWRLPDIDELSTIIYCSNGNPDYYSNGKNANSDINDWGCFGKPGKDHNRPTIAQDVFPNCPSSLFWSKSRDIQFSGPYGVYFGYGSISNANDTGITHARLVRKD